MFERTQLDENHVLLFREITGDQDQSYDLLLTNYRRFFNSIYISNERLQVLSEEQASESSEILSGEVIAAPMLHKVWRSKEFRDIFEQAILRRREEGESGEPIFLCLAIYDGPIDDSSDDEELFDQLF
jgi:hypothetical protein